MAGQVSDFEINFKITDHPHLRLRKEDHVNLEFACRTDILQGAFMGDAILRVPGADFSTPAANHGWRGLVEWCLGLDAAITAINGGAVEHRISEPDGEDFVMIRRDGPELVFSGSRSSGVGRVSEELFLQEARNFIRRTVLWIGER